MAFRRERKDEALRFSRDYSSDCLCFISLSPFPRCQYASFLNVLVSVTIGLLNTELCISNEFRFWHLSRNCTIRWRQSWEGRRTCGEVKYYVCRNDSISKFAVKCFAFRPGFDTIEQSWFMQWVFSSFSLASVAQRDFGWVSRDSSVCLASKRPHRAQDRPSLSVRVCFQKVATATYYVK
jgi:hypothetical protein